MPLVRAVRLLNALEKGDYTSTQLETALATDIGMCNEFRSLVLNSGYASRLVMSPSVVDTILKSNRATDIIGRAQPFISAMYNYDDSIVKLQLNPTAIQRLISYSPLIKYKSVSISIAAFTFNEIEPYGTRGILLRRWYATPPAKEYLMCDRNGSVLPDYGTSMKTYDATYTVNSGNPSDNDTGNRALAFAGLGFQPNATMPSGSILYCRYFLC